MDPTDDLWTAIRRVLPDAEELAAAVAAELGEPLDDVRPSVLIGTIAMNGQLGPEAAAAAAIEAELGGLQPAKGTRPHGRLVRRRLARRPPGRDAGSRGRGFARPRDDRGDPARFGRDRGADRPPAGRPAAPLRGHPAPDLGALRRRDAGGPAGPGLLAAFGRFLLLWNELTSLAVTDGYRTAERDILARAVEARRGALQELLGVVADDAASRGPTAPRGGATRPEPRPRVPPGRDRAAAPRATRSPSGRASARRSSRCSRDGSATCSGRPPRAPRASAQGSGCRPCCRSWVASPSSPVTTGPG